MWRFFTTILSFISPIDFIEAIGNASGTLI